MIVVRYAPNTSPRAGVVGLADDCLGQIIDWRADHES